MRSTIRSIISPLVPQRIKKLKRNFKLRIYRNRNKKRLVKDVFTRVYRENDWGGKVGDFCSGSGSNEYLASIYADMVKNFIKERHISTIVDLGCGDFVVGRKLLEEGIIYIGVDIVDELVERNRSTFSNANVSFVSLDIISDPLPEGELCLIRQVFQHLSNSQIVEVINKLGNYKYVLITEHYPSDHLHMIPNKGKPHGGDTRIVDNSAVYLDLPPFNMKILRKMLEVEVPPIVMKGEKIITYWVSV